MTIKNTALAAIVALGAAASAFAQGSVGDLILGFNPSGTNVASGTSTDLEVDLGSVSGYLTAGPGTYTVASLGSDLTSTYGSTWDSTTLNWGVVGVVNSGSIISGAANKTAWTTDTESSGTFPAPTVLGGNNTTSVSHITGVYNVGNTNSTGLGGSATTALSDLTSQTDAVNGATLFGQTNAAGTGAAFTQELGSSGFGIGNVTNAILETAVDSGHSADLLQLTSNSGTAGTDIGYFTLASNGTLSFTVSAIPEPSTYAAALGALTIGFVLLYRRRSASAAMGSAA